MSEREETPPADVPAEEREALLDIAHGAVVTSGGVSVQRALTSATEFVLARALGPSVYGVYAFAWRITHLLFRFVNFGGVQTLQRYVPALDDAPAARNRMAGLAYATTLTVGLGLGVALVAGADAIDVATVESPLFAPTLGAFAALLVLTGVVKVHAALLRATGSARGEVLFNRVLRPAVRLLGAAGALALGYSVVGVAGAFVLGVGLLAAVGFPATVRTTGIRPTLRGAVAETRRFYNHAAPIAVSALGIVFQNRVDVIMVGVLLTATAAGVYNVVLVMVSIAWIPLVAFNQLMPPVASELHAAGETETLNAVYRTVARLVFTAALPILAVQVVFGRELLALFGPTYVRGHLPLSIYLLGVAFGSAVGGNGWLMMMTDHQYARLALNWLLASTNVVLTYLFVLEFGLLGAALGTSIAISAQNLLEAVVLRHFEGLWPFDATFLKPVSATVAMGATMLAVRAALGGLLAVVVGSIVGLLVFLGTLVALGVSPRDRLVVGELSARYRETVTGALPIEE
jgi:O-antigen/teichoic acid export membrane protein